MKRERWAMGAYGWRATAVVMLVVALAGACSESTESPPPDDDENAPQASVRDRVGKTFVYACNDGLRFTARIEGEMAWLFLPSGTLKLQKEEAASGARYGDGSVTFWSKAGEALLDRTDQPRLQCVNDRAQAIWEDAKLRGVDFRGRGNEPGWHIEISKSYGIVFVTNYGADRYHFETFQSVSDETSRKTTFITSDAERELRVTLEGRRCSDSMSGETFATAVTVTFDGKQLNGCGKALH